MCIRDSYSCPKFTGWDISWWFDRQAKAHWISSLIFRHNANGLLCLCSHQRLCIRESQEVLKIFNNLLLMYLPTLILACAPKFVRVWCDVVENVLELKDSNLKICHRNCLPWLLVFSNATRVFSEFFKHKGVISFVTNKYFNKYLTVLLLYYRVSV